MQSKLKLNLDELTVDSFHTAAGDKAKGTVFGEQQCTCLTQCGQNTCPGCPTCDGSCGGTCEASCNGTCNCQTNVTCVYACGYTDFDCPVETCQQTNCGRQLCCA